jgi:hypothetical protein
MKLRAARRAGAVGGLLALDDRLHPGTIDLSTFDDGHESLLLRSPMLADPHAARAPRLALGGA